MMKLGLLMVLVASVSLAFGEGEEVIFPGTKPNDEWWSNAMIYQVYPRSFKDSDGDGIGDLKGITQQLDYFVDLGVDVVWINPIFKSPMDNMGFDVENHTVIDPMFGTMEDFEELVAEVKKRDLKLIIDFVPNRSSYKCEWFSKSIKREGKYGDYYIWHDALNQDQADNETFTPTPPNNWLSVFGGSAWSWNAERKQFYLHQYTDREPDLNHRNPEVNKEFLNIMKFWMDKGVDGFRFSSLGRLFVNETFPDEPKRSGHDDWPIYLTLNHIYSVDQPEVIDRIIEWRKFMDDYSKKNNLRPKLFAAEAQYHICVYSLRFYYGYANNPGAQVPFNYHLMIQVRRTDLAFSVERAIKFWFEVVSANNTPSWVMENQDMDRISSIYGPEAVQVFTALKLALPGVDITYYGSEIGMENTYVRPDQIKDSYNSSGKRSIKSRDFARSPMQWNDKPNAGFTKAKTPWLPVNPNYFKLNVETQKQIPTSNYNFFKKMSGLRKTDTMKYGDLSSYNITETVYIIKRSLPGHETYLVVMNFGSEVETVVLSKVVGGLRDELYVYLGSENSAHSGGDIVSTTSASDRTLVLKPLSVVVLTDGVVKVTSSAANSHKRFNSLAITGLLSVLSLTMFRIGSNIN
ncbi:maltase A3-like [Sipha flava]|uniref:alpha-glucosidase n=1 Tax=Sipha flava TaxID=143950 RepID=A0A8B8FLT4_9HEMI|nr:maltase A3-like [Sipha flava]XP_025411885.1 maltase A3-like [Sipha flava]